MTNKPSKTINTIDDHFRFIGHQTKTTSERKEEKRMYRCIQCREKMPEEAREEHMYYAHTNAHTRYYYNGGYGNA